MAEERRLAAIMFTDMVGYTSLMGRDEARARGLVERSRSELKSFVEKHHGQWLEEIGDGTLSVFSSAVEAAACALEIQRTFGNDEITLRIGIHLGDVVFANGRVYGDGVNVAARIEPLARPGGIAVSESVAQAMRGHPQARLSYLGRKRLKNVDQPVRVYTLAGASGTGPVEGFLRELWSRWVPQVLVIHALAAWTLFEATEWLVDHHGLAPQWPELLLVVLITLTPALVLVTYYQTPREGRRLGPIERIGVPLNLLAALLVAGVFLRVAPIERGSMATPTIAVLPLDNLSADAADDYLVDGLTEELIGAIGTLTDVNVIARHSSFRYKGRDYDLEEVADALKATHVVAGSVRKVQDTIRVSVQLVDTSAKVSRWSQSYQRQMTATNLFEIQKSIASSVADRLNAGLLATSRYRREKPPTDNLQAYEHFLRAQQIQATGGSYLEIRHHIDKALELDESFADAHAWRAVLTMVETWASGVPMPEVRALAKAHIDRAEILDPESPTLYWALFIWNNSERRHDKAVAAIEKAIELAPSWAILYHDYAAYLRAVPFDLDKALQMARRAHTIDPMNPRALAKVVEVLDDRGDLKAMRKELSTLTELHPNYPRIAWMVADDERSRGNFAKALASVGSASMGGVEQWLKHCRLLADLESLELLDQCSDYARLREVYPADFVTWQTLQARSSNARRLLEGHVMEAQPRYWRGYVRVPVTLVRAGDAHLVPDFLDRMDPDWRESRQEGVIEFIDRFRSLIYTAVAIRSIGDAGIADELVEVAAAMRPKIQWPNSKLALDLQHSDLLLDMLQGKEEVAFRKFEERVDSRALANWVLFETDPAFEFLQRHPRYNQLMAVAKAHAQRQREMAEELGLFEKGVLSRIHESPN